MDRTAFEVTNGAQRVVFGPGTFRTALADEVARLGGTRVMLLTTRRWLAEAQAALGPSVAAAFSDVREHVPIEVVAAATRLAVEARVDLLVSIGGGSATGTAKALARSRELSGVPIVAVPTTYAGSEVTSVWGFTDGAGKKTGRGPAVLPQTVVYDPEASRQLPVELSINSGLNAVAHCVDALWAPRGNPASDALASEGLRRLASALRTIRADPADRTGRDSCLRGAYLAGLAFERAGSGLHHKICHVLGGRFGLPHAATHAVLLPYVTAFNLPSDPAADRRLAAALDAPDGLSGLTTLYGELRPPASLERLGLAEADLVEVARLAVEAAPPSNPRPFEFADAERLLHAAWAGDPVAEPGTTSRSVASFARAADPRVRGLLQALVRHSHAFAREVGLTEGEWAAGVDFVTRCGQVSDEARQEVVLLSDVLGLSMLTVDLNAPADPAATEATVLGPFFHEGSPEVELGADIRGNASGLPCWVEGAVTDPAGRPVAGARVEVWEADDTGSYDVQYGDGRVAGRAHLFTDDAGRYCFWGVVPTPYPIPYDGPVGELLSAGTRSPMRAPHLHFLVTALGFHRLVTHIFVRGGDHLDDDAVFGVRRSLIVDFALQPPEATRPDGGPTEGPWARVSFPIVLAPEPSAQAGN